MRCAHPPSPFEVRTNEYETIHHDINLHSLIRGLHALFVPCSRVTQDTLTFTTTTLRHYTSTLHFDTPPRTLHSQRTGVLATLVAACWMQAATAIDNTGIVTPQHYTKGNHGAGRNAFWLLYRCSERGAVVY